MDAETRTIRILLVEDDAVDALLVRRTLSAGTSVLGHLMPGYDLTHVEALPPAIELLREQDFDVVLLDLNLGEFRGIETFFELHRQVPDVPVVVLTGLADDEIALRAIREGAQDYLIKEQLEARLLGRTIRYAMERQRLREAERTAQRYLDVAAVLFVLLLPDQTVGMINRRGCELLGYDEAEVIGRNWFDAFIPERLRGEMREVFSRIVEGAESGLDYYENPVLTRSGGERVVAWHNTILRDRHGRFQGALSSGQDVTERRQAELSLRESERRLSTLMANLPGMAYRCENRPEWPMEFVSQGALELCGYEPEELVGGNRGRFRGLIVEEDRERLWQDIQEAVASARPFELEYRIRRRDGEQRWVVEYGRAVSDTEQTFLEGIITDITGRKQAEQGLARSNARLRTLQSLDRDILAAQTPRAVAEAALAAIQKLVPTTCCAGVLLFDFGQGQATVLASTVDAVAVIQRQRSYPLSGFFGLEELRHGYSVVFEDLSTSDSLSTLHRTLLAAGVRGYASVPLIAGADLVGSLNLYRMVPGAPDEEELAIARELADSVAIAIHQSRLFEQIRRHSEELEQRVAERTRELQETNAELEAFAYSVSHDLRNPLWNIQGFTEAIRDRYGKELGAEGSDLTDSILESVRSMDTLIGDLLDYSRASRAAVRFEPVALEPVVDEAIGQVRPRLEEKAGRISVDRPLPVVLGQESTLLQVVGNLVSNAVKFSRPGVPPEVRLRAEQSGPGRVRLWVEDQGIGIPPQERERVFRVFERLDESYPGTGVGLATVRRAAERLGGAVGVESDPGKGSRFWVELRTPAPPPNGDDERRGDEG